MTREVYGILDPDDPWYVLLVCFLAALVVVIAIEIGCAIRWLWRKILRQIVVCIVGGTLIACAVVILGWGGWR